MSPLEISVYAMNEWGKVGEVGPDSPPGSMTNIREDGRRELYLFECSSDDTKSTIYRSGLGVDYEIPEQQGRMVTSNPSRTETLKELTEGETYELWVHTEKSPEPRLIRFKHKQAES